LEQGAALLHAALTLAPDDPGLLYGLSFILLRLENFQDAADVLADIIATNIEDAGVWRNYGTALGFLKNFEKCFPALEHARDLEPDHPLAYNTLSRFYEESGNTKNARKFAMRGLLLKDRLANQDFERLQHAHKLDLQGKGSTGTKSVIAVSLWGSHPTFNRGAIEYTEQAKDIFPDWVCRFYHDETVPARTLGKLGQLGAECIAVTTKQKQVHGAFWRFFASDDPEVAWFQCRDADCRPSERERAAVEAWQKSGQNFHIMRDHMWHSDLILAGLWGGRAGILPNMEQLTYALYGEQGDRYDDQLFLARAIWPLIKGHSVTHDSTFYVFPAEPFPTGNARTEEEHVGYSFRYTERKRTMKLNLNTKTLEVNTVSDTNS
jgi:tetratricopeptide (TPR) repeat protein